MATVTNGLDQDLRERIDEIEGELESGATQKDVTSGGVWVGFIFGLIIPIVLLAWGYVAYVL